MNRAGLVLLGLLCGCADSMESGSRSTGPDAGSPLSGNVQTDDAARGPARPAPDGGPYAPGECTPVEEVCDGVDDDCNGVVDEGCLCRGSAECYGGPPATRGVGACLDGMRDCDDLGELWRDCQHWVGPSPEVCGDGVDDDCDGEIDQGCPTGPEVCGDGLDNDRNGEVDEGCARCEVEERCGNREDDDCDGEIDEGCLPECGPAEICGDGLDDDCDGQIDEGCDDECPPDLARACFPGPPAIIGVGGCRAGRQACTAGGRWGPCDGAVGPGDEICDNGVDDNCDGRVDEGCRRCEPVDLCGNGIDDDCDGEIDEGCGDCRPGETRPCGGARAGVGACLAGAEACGADAAWTGVCEGAVEPRAEVCGNGVDEDCDGADAACGPVEVPILLVGDCLTVRCPAEAPHPVGCLVFFTPGDDRGCVASRPDNPVVYFQAGDQCDRGFVTGRLYCADRPGDRLGPANCPINKPIPIYPADRSGCPDTH